MAKMKIAFLVLDPFRNSDYSDDSFDGLEPIAEYLLKHVLETNAYKVDFCSVDSAFSYDIVLVSLRSTPQYYAFLKQALKKWRRRTFKVIVGGQGLTHPSPLWEVADYFWYGRAENHICKIVQDIENTDNKYWLRSGEIKKVSVCQPISMYPEPIDLPDGKVWKEHFIGCPNKCYYCYYSWNRKTFKISKGYLNDVSYFKSGRKNSSVEVDMHNFNQYNGDKHFILTGLDGLTQTLRYSVNRKVSDEQVVEALLHFDSAHKGNGIIVKMFNIINTEGSNTERDVNEFKEKVILRAVNKIKKRITISLQHTPLIPAPGTPLMFSRCLSDNKSQVFLRKQIRIIKDWPIKCFHHKGIMSGAGVLENVAIERFSEKYRDMVYTIALNSKYRNLNADSKTYVLQSKWDTRDLTRRYETTEKPPCWFIEGITTFDKIKRLREKQIEQYGDMILNGTN